MEQKAEQFSDLVRKRLYRRLHALARPLAELTDVFCEPGSQLWNQCFKAATPDRFTGNTVNDPFVSDCDSGHASFVSGCGSDHAPFVGVRCLDYACATDGNSIFWNSCFLAKQPDAAETEALFLHQVIHCLFGHPFSMPLSCPQETWDLACDIAAWHILSVWTPELLPADAASWLAAFSARFPGLSLYQPRRLAETLTGQPLSDPQDEAISVPELPLSDSHRLWPIYNRQNRVSSIKKGRGNGGGEKAQSGEGTAKKAALWNRLQRQLAGKDAPLSPEKHQKKKPGAWSGETRNVTQKIRLSGARRHDYRDLLKSLARWGEEMKLNDNEFQYASYLYGLEHYDGMPLLEPLEYEETSRIRELAIVIDTSASCSHSLTQAFLEETRNLLLEEDLFFHPFNLHILQCDKEVERDDKVTSSEDLKDYIDTLEICGMGGTDFRPAFSHIRYLQDCREFTDLSAILFFTDGSGLYPSEAPDARTVFIFLKGHYEAIDVPDWAEILVLETNETR